MVYINDSIGYNANRVKVEIEYLNRAALRWEYHLSSANVWTPSGGMFRYRRQMIYSIDNLRLHILAKAILTPVFTLGIAGPGNLVRCWL